MPNCFQLFAKKADGTVESRPVILTFVDELICSNFGAEVHPTRWYYGWYDVIGFAIAMGKPLGSQELRDYVADRPANPEMLLWILDFLENHFSSNAWVEIGKR